MVKRLGIEISYHGQCAADPTNVSASMTVTADVIVTSAEWITSRAVRAHDDLSVTVSLYTSAASASREAEPDGGFEAILARGSPCVDARDARASRRLHLRNLRIATPGT